MRIRIAKLQKQTFGASSEKIEREIEQLELALEDLMVAKAEADDDAARRGRDPGARPAGRGGRNPTGEETAPSPEGVKGHAARAA